jgi:hypothetical protein
MAQLASFCGEIAYTDSRGGRMPVFQVTRLHEDIAGSRRLFVEVGGHFLSIDTPVETARATNGFVG